MLLGDVERGLAVAGVDRLGDEVVLVACSGGVDSVVLAHATATLLGARRVIVAHVDHGVRPGSADDAAFVERFARSIGADHEGRRVRPASDAEADLRAARYEALEAMRAQTGAVLILTAHTEDDQAETVLMNLLRHAHPDALGGIPGRRGHVLRPLLTTSRAAVAVYAEAHALAFRDDATNREPRYLRNRIRKELLPLIERRYRSGFRHRLAALARAVSGVGENADEPEVRGNRTEPRPRSRPPAIAFERRPWTLGARPDASFDGKATAIFDADALIDVRIRRLEDGDRIRPFGHSGRRKVRDILREAGIPAEDRADRWVVEAAGEVVWVPGLARSDAAPVRETTKDVWVFWTSRPAELQAKTSHATPVSGAPGAGGVAQDREDGPLKD